MSHFTRPRTGLLGPTVSSKPSNTPKQLATRQTVAQAKDDLLCEHFATCDGCSLEAGLHTPPKVDTARQFLAARGFQDFQTVPGPVHGWRCRARLAVRGSAGAPVIGLFQAGSHNVAAIPDCRAHHPRINEAVQLLQQVAAALRIQPYQEQQQQHGASSSTSGRPPTTSSSKQQQGQRRAPAAGNDSSSSSSKQQRGFLRYLQLTAVSSSPGGRAEDDPAAQIQLVLVWAAPDASHPSVADARRLAAALWSRGGPREASPLAVLRARAEAKAAAAPGRPGSSKLAVSRQKQRATAGPPAGSSRGSSSTIQSAGSRIQQQQGQGQTPPLLHSMHLNFQPAEGSNRITGDSWLLLHGPPVGWQQFGGAALALAPGSFVQANFGAMQRCLAAIVAATPPRSSVLELYAGSGVIGLALAAAGRARRVACVEVNPESAAAFEAARDQLAASDPVSCWLQAAAAVVSHHVGSAGDAALVRRLLAASGAELMVVDPPRKGLDAPLVQLLTEAAAGPGSSGGSVRGAAAGRGDLLGSAVEQSGGQQQALHHSSHLRRLIYLSCGFEALMRDCDALLTAGWRLSSCVAFFFFPGTDSIETLAVFEREEAAQG